ncbi:MAG: hypothetical protein RLZZ299_33 [Pseudomonadota bacterium]|jgi:hypothetical protein
MLALLLALTLAARADDPDAPPDEDGAAPGAAPDARDQVGATLAATMAWEHRGTFRQRGPVTGLAVAAARGSAVPTWLAIDTGGWIWRSEDRGSTWMVAMRGEEAAEGADEERLLMNAEALRDDELRSVEEAPVDGVQAAPDPSVVQDVVSRANDDAAAVIVADRNGAEATPRVWFHPTDPELALVGRADGTWRSLDGGFSWEWVDSAAITDVEVVGDLLVAGTQDGVRWSTDEGRTWIDVDDSTGGAPVRDLEVAGRWIYAATSRGLYRSADGLRWAIVPALAGLSVVDVTADPSWQGGAWVITATSLIRTDDDGATFYDTERASLKDVREVIPLRGAGHLIAITGDGPWETIDGGLRWVPLARLLTEPDVRDVALDAGLPVIATRSGIYALAVPVELAERPRALPLPQLYTMVDIAQNRRGLDSDMLSLSRRRLLAAATPRVDLDWQWDRRRGRDADHAALANSAYDDTAWSFLARACWGNCAASASGYVSDPADAAFDDTLFVVGEEVYDDGNAIAAAANVAQGIRDYRRNAAAVVTEAWMRRQRLNQEQAVVDLLPLRDRVMHALDVAEADARLDAWTEGAFTRDLARLNAPSPETP